MNDKVRVLIADDSAVVRGLLTRVLEADSGIEVAGSAMHGQAALNWLERNDADVVLLDVEMPIMDGIETLTQITRRWPDVPVVMASSLTSEGAETTIKALKLGAAGCIAKPQAKNVDTAMREMGTTLVPLVIELGRKHLQAAAVAPPTHVTRREAGNRQTPPRILVVGSSTGGPRALSDVLGALPRDFPLPTLIVQHMPPLFTPMLAKHLEQDTGRPAREATDGEPIVGGTTYVAPGDFHMLVENGPDGPRLRIRTGEPEHFCRPSVNPMFRTAVDVYGDGILAVMLTGMGSDGLEGTRDIVDRGGYVIAQDEASSVVWGMPGAIAKDGLAHEILPLGEIAGRIEHQCREVAVL